MLKIRLQRFGKSGKPFYKIIVTENTCCRDGKMLEQIGFYDPISKKIQLNIKSCFAFLKNGAYPTDSVRRIIYQSIKCLRGHP